ncbi:hypothetical protein [Nesterenkonia muleiensis]|uniref:hypothetical protein n=1 Tax=Nesterenkonia muleiensis TaxID=2282648 RepID=UPI0013006C41|nr:hypothetical protein [Nesterenkonia muleiensis]
MSTSTSTPDYGAMQRAALAVSAVLAAWAEASARRKRLSAAAGEGARHRRIRRQQAELRREAAITERLLMPRQF